MIMPIPEQPFGFVAGRWVLSMADTPVDGDRAPDYKPLTQGTIVFTNKLSHRVIADGSSTVGIVKTRIEGKLDPSGQLVDDNNLPYIALPVGAYSVSYSFPGYSWPAHDILVEAEHALENPLWLPSVTPPPPSKGVVIVATEGARIAAEAAAERAENAAQGVFDYDLFLGLVEPLVDDAVSVGLAGVDDLVASALVPYATTAALTSGLASKQPVGDYVTTSELPDLGAYATTAYVDQVVGDIDTALAGILEGN